jgi:cytochrome c peroxidase
LREVIEHYTTNMIKTPDITVFFVGSGQLCCGLVNPRLSEDQKRDLEAFLHALTDQAVLTDPRWSDPFLQ